MVHRALDHGLAVERLVADLVAIQRLCQRDLEDRVTVFQPQRARYRKFVNHLHQKISTLKRGDDEMFLIA